MAFSKTGISVTTPKPFPNTDTLQIGDRRDEKVWDGKKWISEDEWKNHNENKNQ